MHDVGLRQPYFRYLAAKVQRRNPVDLTPFEQLKRLAGGSGYTISREQYDQIVGLLATRVRAEGTLARP